MRIPAEPFERSSQAKDSHGDTIDADARRSPSLHAVSHPDTQDPTIQNVATEGPALQGPAMESASRTVGLPSRLGDVATAGGLLLADAVPTAVDGLSHDDRRAMLTRLNDVMTRLHVVRTRLIMAEDTSGDWACEGDKNMEAWLGRTTGAGYGPAKNDLDMARTVHDLPVVEQALENGTMTIEHVKATSRHYANASDPQREALASPDGQEGLVDKAATTDATRFNRQLGQDLARIDATKLERDRAAVKKRRYVTLVNHAGGMKLDGFLDPVAGQHLRAALDAASPRPATDDTRTGRQRRADALTTIATTTLDAGTFKPGGHVRPHIMVTLTAAEWADWQRAGRIPTQAPGATIDDDTPLTPSETETLLCDCTIMRAVLDTQGQPIDLGRDKRTFSTHLRKALQLRDGHCTWPGCTMPAGYTEGHHINKWTTSNTSPGGTTNLDNGILLCSYHHHYVHAKAITITPITNGHRFTHPNGHITGEHHYNTGPPPDWAQPPNQPANKQPTEPQPSNNQPAEPQPSNNQPAEPQPARPPGPALPETNPPEQLPLQ